MRPKVCVLLLAVLFLAFGLSPCLAEANSVGPAAPAAIAADAGFLTAPTACAARAETTTLPTPIAAATSCTSTAQCPKGQLCCLACGFFGCTARACFAPMNGHCPFFP